MAGWDVSGYRPTLRPAKGAVRGAVRRERPAKVLDDPLWHEITVRVHQLGDLVRILCDDRVPHVGHEADAGRANAKLSAPIRVQWSPPCYCGKQ